jgi:hypothetical protein
VTGLNAIPKDERPPANTLLHLSFADKVGRPPDPPAGHTHEWGADVVAEAGLPESG